MGRDRGTAWQLIEDQEKFTLLEIATAAESVGLSTRSRRWQGVSTLNTIDLWFYSMQTSSTGLRDLWLPFKGRMSTFRHLSMLHRQFSAELPQLIFHSYVSRSNEPRGIHEKRSEVTLELTYLAQLGAHLAVQPNLQYVINPNTDPRIKNAVAFILRFELSHSDPLRLPR